MENFVLILEVCKFWRRMNHMRRKEPSPSREEDRKETWWERRGTKPYCNSQTRSCIKATNLPLLVAGTEIHCWGSRKKQWTELIVEDLTKERAVDGIRPFGNRINNYINQIFADSWHCSKRPCGVDLRLL